MKKRKISFIIVINVILTMGIGGCSKEKIVIVDTNIQDNKNTGVNISEETINLKVGDGLLYSPRFFDGEEIYGTFGTSGGRAVENGTDEFPIVGFFKKNLYTLEKDDSIKETDIKPAFYNWGIGKSEGIGIDEIPVMLGDDTATDIYYYNDKTGEKRKIGLADSSDNDERQISHVGETKMIEGQAEFGYTIVSERKSYGGDGSTKGEDKVLKLCVFGINNGEKYEYKGSKISAIGDIVYSKSTEKFYAIDVAGKLYNVELKNNEAKFTEVDNIDIKWLDRINESSISVNPNGEILIFNKLDYGQVLIIIYNPKTKKTTYINKGDNEEIKVLKYFTEGNKVILGKKTNYKNEEIYIGEIKDDYIKMHTNLNIPKNDDEYSGFRSAIMSDDGQKMLVGILMFKPEDGYIANERYVFKILTFN